ncbi:MAG: NB-ARC domain-containing protein [Phormidesmis sp.]
MSQPGIPEDLLIPIAKANRVSDKELEALKLALKKNGSEHIAAQLGISKAAARKRLGEVYRKFEIEGSGPGKLASLKKKLREQIFGTGDSKADDPKKMDRLHAERLDRAIARAGVSPLDEHPIDDSQWLNKLPTTALQLNTRYHLEGAPEASFQERARELKELRRWILRPARSQKLLAICGMGGIGKTSLAVQLSKELDKNFEQIVWLKIEQTKMPEFCLQKLLHILRSDHLTQNDSSESVDISPKDIDDAWPADSLGPSSLPASAPSGLIDILIQQLVDYISKRRCLIILDGFESVFRGYETEQEAAAPAEVTDVPSRTPTFSASRRHQASVYKHYFKGYRRLLRVIRQSSKQRPSIGASCVVLTSREKPRELLSLLEDDPMARLYTLGGLSHLEASRMLRGFGLQGSDEDYKQLVTRYEGHPMALRLAADTIKDVFFGRVRDFLEQETSVFDELRSVLKRQFKRLPPIEKEVVYWLVINCKACTLDELKADIVALDHKQNLVYTLQSLERRSLVEIKQADGVLFSLHPIVRQYVLDRFVRDIFQDLVRGNLDTFNRYALMKADAEETLREFQIERIVGPILHRLKNYFKGLYGVEDHLSTKLDEFRHHHPQRLGYAGGNFINLMVQLSPEQLSDKNFSQLTIWQAYLQRTKLRDVQFNGCLIERSVFTETLSDVMAIALSTSPQSALPIPGQSLPLLAAGDTNGMLHLWQTLETHFSAGQKRAEWLAHNSWVRAIAFVPNSPLLVTAGDDSRLKLWQLPTQPSVTQPEQLWQQSAKDWIHTVAASPDGRMIASGGDNKITLYCIQDGHIISQFPRQATVQPERGKVPRVEAEVEAGVSTTKSGHSRIRALTFSPDSQRLASCGDDYTIRLWSVAALSNEAIDPSPIELEGHTDWVRTVCFSPDGTKLVSGSEDKKIIVWDTASGCQLESLDRAGDRVRSVAISSDGQFLASGGDDAQVMLWDFKTFQFVGSLATQQSRIWSVAFQQQGEKLLLAAGGDRQTLLLWQVGADIEQTGVPAGALAAQRSLAGYPQSSASSIRLLRTYRGYANGIRAIAFVGNERIVSGGDSGELSIWDTAGDRKATLPLHQGRIWSLAADSQNALIASAGNDHTIRLWDAETGQCLTALSGHTSWVRAIAFSHGGHLLVSSGDDCTIKIWNTASGFCLTTLKQEHHWIRAVGFNPENARYLISGGDDQRVRRWDRRDGSWEALAQHEHRVCSVAYSPDGKMIASGSDDTTVLLWDTDKGEVTHRFTQSELGIKAVAFSPNGQYLAAGGEDQLVYIWDLKAPAPHQRCFILLPKDAIGRTGGIRSIAFSPNSQFVISGGLDEMIRIGDLRQIEDSDKRMLRPLNGRDRPYENVEIERIKGLSRLQLANLLALGAVNRTHSLLTSP